MNTHLRSGVAPDLIEPDRAKLVEQVGVELEVSKAHLRSILDQYWDHLWRATAVTELEGALIEFGL